MIGRLRSWLASRWVRSKYERVIPHKLHRAIDEADRLIVRHHVPDGSVLFESGDRSDFDKLKESLAVVEFPVTGFEHCMCLGEEAIHLYRVGKQTVQLTNHHGTSVRCNLWGSDARIVHQEKWLAWLTQHVNVGR